MQVIKQLVEPTKFIETYLQVTQHNPKVKKQKLYSDLEKLREYTLGSRAFKNWNSFSVQRIYHTRKATNQL